MRRSATLVEQNTSTTRTSTGTGDYNITPLIPGLYTLKVTATGFETLVQNNITVNGLQNITINVKLPIGTNSEVVTST